MRKRIGFPREKQCIKENASHTKLQLDGTIKPTKQNTWSPT